MLTGQLIFRETNAPPPRKGHRIMMVCGVIAVPDDWQIKGEHQYIVTDHVHPDTFPSHEDIHIHLESETDLTSEIRGITLNGLIMKPLWKV